MNIKNTIFGILVIIFIFAFLKIYFNEKQDQKYKLGIKQIVRIGIFGAFSAILYAYIKFPVPFFPSFLEFHFDEVTIFIASFAYGPISGLLVILIKTLIKLVIYPSTTLFVGEISDILFSIAFVMPAAVIYNRNRNFKSVIVGIIVGAVAQLVISLLGNVYLMMPFYLKLLNMSEAQMLGVLNLAIPAITDIKWSYGLLAILPFNLIKDISVIFVTILSYKSLHKFVDKLQA